MESLQENAIKR